MRPLIDVVVGLLLGVGPAPPNHRGPASEARRRNSIHSVPNSSNAPGVYMGEGVGVATNSKVNVSCTCAR